MKYADLTPELERELVTRYQAGDRTAGAALLDAHWPILVHLMQRLRNRGVDDADVMQTACVEFLDRASRWDRSPSVRLTSFASQGAFFATKTAVWKDTTIRVSEYALTERTRCRKHGLPMPDRLALALDMRSTVPLDQPANNADGEMMTLADVTPSDDPGSESRYGDEEAQARRCALVIKAMSAVSAKERDILRRRFMSDERESFNEIGRAMGISHDRANQACKRAVAKATDAIRAVMAEDDAILWGGQPASPVLEAA
jgi:RNA polymerase sigma factor (sigma-70 family)